MAGTCGTMLGGRRRSRKMKGGDGSCGMPGGRRRRRTMKGGMGYGFGGAMGTNGPVWDASWGGEITKGGEPIYDTADRPPVTGGRRRKSKKAKKGGRRRRTMRGGAPWQSIAPVGYSFTGSGERGLANVDGYASKVPPSSGGPSQNPDGAYSP
jgi:hypothetical protein